jgi:hypothetical protein
LKTKEPGVLKCEELDLELEVLSISFYKKYWTLARVVLSPKKEKKKSWNWDWRFSWKVRATKH